MINPIDGTVTVTSPAPCKEKKSVSSDKEYVHSNTIALVKWQELLEMVEVNSCCCETSENFIKFPAKSTPTNSIQEPIQVEGVYIKNRNLPVHQWQSDGLFLLKPGSLFEFSLRFYRDLKPNFDSVDITFQSEKLLIGDPMEVEVVLDGRKSADFTSENIWHGRITSINGKVLSFDIFIPSDVGQGRWAMKITTKNASGNEKSSACTYVLNGVYISVD